MPLDHAALDAIEALEPLPVTAQRLLGVLGNEDVPLQEIGAILEHDPAVAANVLRIANSSLYGARFPVERVRDAVVRLGAGALLDIVVGGYLRRVGRDAPLYDLGEDDLWLHSAVASLAVQEIARVASVPIPPAAGIAALVHDIGKLIMIRYQKAKASAVLAVCAARGVTFIEAERELFGCDHAEVGAAVARRWTFPEAVTDAIARHHEFPLPAGSTVLDAVVTANFVAKTIGIGLGAEGLNLHVDQEALRRLGLDFEAFCRVCARTTGRVAELKKTYNLS